MWGLSWVFVCIDGEEEACYFAEGPVHGSLGTTRCSFGPRNGFEAHRFILVLFLCCLTRKVVPY